MSAFNIEAPVRRTTKNLRSRTYDASTFPITFDILLIMPKHQGSPAPHRYSDRMNHVEILEMLETRFTADHFSLRFLIAENIARMTPKRRRVSKKRPRSRIPVVLSMDTISTGIILSNNHGTTTNPRIMRAGKMKPFILFMLSSPGPP